MALSYPIALHFPPIRRALLPRTVDAITAAMKSYGKVPERFHDLAAELIFEQYSGEWLDTTQVRGDYPGPGAALARGKWLRLSFDLRIATGVYPAELYVFPLLEDPEMAGMQLNFEGRVYAAVYEFETRVAGKFDDRAKASLSAVIYGVAAAADADAFIVFPEDGAFRTFSVDEVIARLRMPDVTTSGKRAGLISGVKSELMSIEEIRNAWRLSAADRRALTTTSGYSVLDLLQRLQET